MDTRNHLGPIFIGSTKFQPDPKIKNILITGGAGFIASYVTRHFTIQYPEYNVICYDKLDYCATKNNINCLNSYPNFKFINGDITDANTTLQIMKNNKIDTIFHFAAQSHVDLSFGNSYAFTHNNVFGTHVLLECSLQANIQRFIHVSTDEVYGESGDQENELLESSILSPTNPYAATKAAAEMLVNAYYKSFKLPIIIIRSNNIFGPHQFPEKIIPKFICLLHRKQKCMLHGDGSPKRRYLFAGDATDAFDTIFHKGVNGEIYNVGSVDEFTNKQLCLFLLDSFGIQSSDFNQWVEFTKDRPFNDMRYAINYDKLTQLGWNQKTKFSDGLSITVDWYRHFGESWWGDITFCLSAFPTTTNNSMNNNEVNHCQ
ncbi:hypothetical protein HDV02_001036 [Globomyces sp. JEL0801]|nr:hypothetical protein HDV02_001036 [Globomyces sp. JEL0801]